jgi:hypothetical protein
VQTNCGKGQGLVIQTTETPADGVGIVGIVFILSKCGGVILIDVDIFDVKVGWVHPVAWR